MKLSVWYDIIWYDEVHRSDWARQSAVQDIIWYDEECGSYWAWFPLAIRQKRRERDVGVSGVAAVERGGAGGVTPTICHRRVFLQ